MKLNLTEGDEKGDEKWFVAIPHFDPFQLGDIIEFFQHYRIEGMSKTIAQKIINFLVAVTYEDPEELFDLEEYSRKLFIERREMPHYFTKSELEFILDEFLKRKHGYSDVQKEIAKIVNRMNEIDQLKLDNNS